MYYQDSELLFPSWVIPKLKDLRGPSWQSIVDHIQRQASTSSDQLAFVLMMTKIAHCRNCQVDSYRAIQGCLQCARQIVKRFPGSEEELIALYKTSKDEVEAYLQEKKLLLE